MLQQFQLNGPIIAVMVTLTIIGVVALYADHLNKKGKKHSDDKSD